MDSLGALNNSSLFSDLPALETDTPIQPKPSVSIDQLIESQQPLKQLNDFCNSLNNVPIDETQKCDDALKAEVNRLKQKLTKQVNENATRKSKLETLQNSETDLQIISNSIASQIETIQTQLSESENSQLSLENQFKEKKELMKQALDTPGIDLANLLTETTSLNQQITQNTKNIESLKTNQNDSRLAQEVKLEQLNKLRAQIRQLIEDLEVNEKEILGIRKELAQRQTFYNIFSVSSNIFSQNFQPDPNVDLNEMTDISNPKKRKRLKNKFGNIKKPKEVREKRYLNKKNSYPSKPTASLSSSSSSSYSSSPFTMPFAYSSSSSSSSSSYSSPMTSRSSSTPSVSPYSPLSFTSYQSASSFSPMSIPQSSISSSSSSSSSASPMPPSPFQSPISSPVKLPPLKPNAQQKPMQIAKIPVIPIEAIKASPSYENSVHKLVIEYDLSAGGVSREKFIADLKALKASGKLNINEKIEGWTGLQLAVGYKKHLAIVQPFFTYNAAANDKVDGWGLLHMICVNGETIGNNNLLEYFLERKVVIHVDEGEFFAPIHVASYYNWPNIVNKLCTIGAKHSERIRGFTPAHYACMPQSTKDSSEAGISILALEELIRNNADLNDHGMGMTPLMLASKHGLLEHVECLLKANLNLKKVKINGKDSLAYAKEFVPANKEEEVRKNKILELLMDSIQVIDDNNEDNSRDSTETQMTISPLEAAATLFSISNNGLVSPIPHKPGKKD